MEKWFIRAAVLLLPFVFWLSGEQFREPKAAALIAMAALFVSITLVEKIHLILGFSFFTFVVSALFYAPVTHYGDIAVIFAAAISCLWAIKETPKTFFKILEFVGILCAIHGFIQISGFDVLTGYKEWADIRPLSMFGQHTLYGPFAVACFSVSLFYRNWFRAIILIIPVILIQSSFTFLSLGVVLTIWAYANLNTKWFWGIVISVSLILAGSIPLWKNSDILNDKGRFSLWGFSLSLANNRPIFGYGFGSYKTIFPLFQNKSLREKNGIQDSLISDRAKSFISETERLGKQEGTFYSAHNEYLQVYFEMGAVGVLCVLSFIFSFISAFRRVLKTTEAWICFSIFFLFAANSIGNFPMHLVPQSLLPLWAYCFIIKMKGASHGAKAKSALQV